MLNLGESNRSLTQNPVLRQTPGNFTDFTIADFVADCRAATPSMAAQLASPDSREYQQHLGKTYLRLIKTIEYLLNAYQQTLENLSKRLRHPKQRLHALFKTL